MIETAFSMLIRLTCCVKTIYAETQRHGSQVRRLKRYRQTNNQANEWKDTCLALQILGSLRVHCIIHIVHEWKVTAPPLLTTYLGVRYRPSLSWIPRNAPNNVEKDTDENALNLMELWVFNFPNCVKWNAGMKGYFGARNNYSTCSYITWIGQTYCTRRTEWKNWHFVNLRRLKHVYKRRTCSSIVNTSAQFFLYHTEKNNPDSNTAVST